MDRVRVRFAPSPTGFLHVGNARTALFNWIFARQKRGNFILRIEDTDIERSSKEYEEKLKQDLLWLGLDWDEGPDVGGAFGPYRQSQRLEAYRRYTEELLKKGNAYYCFCSQEELERERRESQARDGMAVYSGKCRQIPREEAFDRIQKGEKAAVRLRTPDRGELAFADLVRGEVKFDLRRIGDPIIVRSNFLPAYNFAVVVDDALMKISHVIRGEDHISNTPLQVLLYRALSIEPPRFAHLSLVMGKDNTRLSKRHGATSIEHFRKEGILPSALFNYLALLGWAPPDGQEVLSSQDLIGLFDLEKVSRSAAIFDYDKLYWINRQQARRLAVRQKAEITYPYLKKAGILPDNMSEAHWDWLEKVADVFVERVDRFSELPAQINLLVDFAPQEMEKGTRHELESDCGKEVLWRFAEKIEKVESFDYTVFAAITQAIKKETGCKGRDLYHPLRIALTAKGSGLDLDKFIPLVEEGAKLDLPRKVKNCSQRVEEMLEFLKGVGFRLNKG
jgi:nondiscriminating glutamyl-tRNA synthetase